MKTQVKLLDSAKQGNLDALVALINQPLEHRQIVASASLNRCCLTITAEAPNGPPGRLFFMDFVRQGINTLKPRGVKQVIVQGKQCQSSTIAWHDQFWVDSPNLAEASPSPSETAPSLTAAEQTTQPSELSESAAVDGPEIAARASQPRDRSVDTIVDTMSLAGENSGPASRELTDLAAQLETSSSASSGSPDFEEAAQVAQATTKETSRRASKEISTESTSGSKSPMSESTVPETRTAEPSVNHTRHRQVQSSRAKRAPAVQKPAPRLMNHAFGFLWASSFLLGGLLTVSVAGWFMPQRMARTEWEYRIVSIADDDFNLAIKELGQEGWELAYARRAIAEKDEVEYSLYEIILKRPKSFLD